MSFTVEAYIIIIRFTLSILPRNSTNSIALRTQRIRRVVAFATLAFPVRRTLQLSKNCEQCRGMHKRRTSRATVFLTTFFLENLKIYVLFVIHIVG